MSEASATHRREIRTAVAGADWDRVEVVKRSEKGEEEQGKGEREPEVYFLHRETGETVWELDRSSAQHAAAAEAGVARLSNDGWLARENKTL